MKEKKNIINHIDEIHSCDLVDMAKYSKINKAYKYIFTNIDIFSKFAWSFSIKSKTIKDIKPCFEKYLKNENLNLYGHIKNQLFSLKKS